MPEVSLNLLKEKIIKTDTVVRLLVDKNEKIVQLREKLKMLYHKYVNKVKECEVLQVRIDLYKIEHDPLVTGIKELTNKYENLAKEHQALINTCEVKYQSKCKELESQVQKYKCRLEQKEMCNKCEDNKVKYESLLKNHSKKIKQLEALNNKRRDDQQKIKDLQSNIDEINGSYCEQIKTLKQSYIEEISKLKDVITASKLCESKLQEEILHLNNKLHLLDTSVHSCNVENTTLCENVENVDNDLIGQNQDDDNDEEFNNVLDMLSYEEVPKILSPLSDIQFIGEQTGNEHMDESELKTTFSSDSNFCDNDNGIPRFDKNVEHISLRCSAVDYVQSAENNESSKEFDPISECCRSEGKLNITNNLINKDEEYKGLNCDDLCGNNCHCTHIMENSFGDIYFGSLKNAEISVNYILENKSGENSNDLILQCFDDNTIDLDNNYQDTMCTNLTDNNNHNTFVNNQFLNSSHEASINQKESIEYIPKCTPPNDLLGFLKGCNIIDKINHTAIKTYSKHFITTEQSMAEKSSLMTYATQQSVFENCSFGTSDDSIQRSSNSLSCTDGTSDTCNKELDILALHSDVLTCVTSINKVMRVENESFECSKVPGYLESICINSLQSNLNNLQNTDEILTTKSNKGNDITLKEQASVNNPLHISSMVKNLDVEEHIIPTSTINNCTGDNQTNLIPLQCMDEKVINYKQQNHNSTVQNGSPLYIASADASVQLQTKLLKSDTITSITSEITEMSPNSQQALDDVSCGSIERPNKTMMDEQQSATDMVLNNNPAYITNKYRKDTIQKRDTLKKTNEELLTTNEEEPLEMSDEELVFREIIEEEIHNQNLLSDHKELEEFYYMSDEMKSDNADSGYIKSDTDEANGSKSCKRKRDENLDLSPIQKKIVLTECFDNEEVTGIEQYDIKLKVNVLDAVRNNEDIVPEANNSVSNQNKINSTVNWMDSNPKKLPKEIGETCLLLDGFESKIDNFVDDSIILPKQNSNYKSNIDCSYLFGSDCESTSSEDQGNNFTNSYPLETTVPSLFAIKGQNKQCINEIPVIKRSVKSNRKRTKSRTCQLVCNKSDIIPKIEPTSNVEDPLRTRLWQDCLATIGNITKSDDAGHTLLYKRSNSLKNRQKLLKELAKPVEASQMKIPCLTEKENTLHSEGSNEIIDQILAIPDKVINAIKSLEKTSCVPESLKHLNRGKARSLLKQLLTFPDKLSIISEAATIFSTLDNGYISRMILSEVSCDTNKADTKYTPPAPVLTDTQRILLGFLVHLNRTTSPGVLDSFIMEAEKHILTSTKLLIIENVTRLYLAVCKLQKKIHRMRRMFLAHG
ncbi:hypothetical protein Trydic_g16566 [Trypoxylus dichotomus]